MKWILLLVVLAGCGGPEVAPELLCDPQLVCPGAVHITDPSSFTASTSTKTFFECEGICANGRHAWMFFEHAEGAACEADLKIWLKWVVNATDC